MHTLKKRKKKKKKSKEIVGSVNHLDEKSVMANPPARTLYM